MPAAPGNATHHELKAQVSADRMQVHLLVPPGDPAQHLTARQCIDALLAAGVPADDNLSAAVMNLVRKPPPVCDAIQKVLVLRGTPVQHGVAGRVEWAVHSEQEEHHDPNEPQNYYEQSAFVVVRAGQQIGRIFEPTEGTEGRDALGKVLSPKPGRPYELALDDTITRDEAGNLTATIDGVLLRKGHSATVHRLMEVKQYVDFSTGNINFGGDVMIKAGVRDRFVVKATGNIEVHGLIEAATIECDGNLVARGGMAGHERGSVRIGHNLIARYLNNVHGIIRGDLCVDREILDCELLIMEAMHSPGGAVFGGKLTVQSTVQVGMLGSGAGVRTELVLGVPLPAPLAQPAKDAADTAAPAAPSTPPKAPVVDLIVTRMIHPGVTLRIGRRKFYFNDAVRGPLHIFVDSEGRAVLQKGTSPAEPLDTVAAAPGV